MILSDRDIKAEIERGTLTITPLNADEQIQPASVDFRLGDELTLFDDVRGGIDPEVDNAEEYSETIEIDEDGYMLEPGEFVLGTTREYVGINEEYIGFVEGRSSWGRHGVTIHVTAGVIDPGYCGEITLEIKNLSKNAIRIRPGKRMGQLVFQRLTTPCDIPYGEERGSKYQNQAGPQTSRLHAED